MNAYQDAVLIFPPQWTPIQPYLSLPSLTAYLRTHGMSAGQFDLNLDFYDRLLSRSYLSPMCETLERFYQQLSAQRSLTPEEQLYLYSIFLIRDAFDEVLEQIDDTKQFLRSERFFDLRELSMRKSILHIAFNIINSYCGIKLSFQDLAFPIEAESLDDVAALLTDCQTRFLVRFFQQQIEEVLSSCPTRLVGFSLNTLSQVVPTLCMARWIKANRPEIHVTIGGNYLSRCTEQLSKFPDFFRVYADSIVRLEGERPLLELARAVKEGRSLADVPNLLYHDGTEVVRTALCNPEDINELPAPDFDGLPIDRYFSPYLILPVLSSRGCYWGKCTFCDHSYVYGSSFRQRDIGAVVSDLMKLKQKYRTRYFSFADEALSPAASRSLSEKIIESGLEVSLLTQARIEWSFSDEVCRLMSRAGFRMVFLGLESACERTLGRIRKGIDIVRAPEILQRFHNAGILVHLYVFFGFPDETRAEADETFQFILDNKESVFSTGASILTVGRYSPIGLHPDRFGVVLRPIPADRPLATSYDYEYVSGQSAEAVVDLHDNYMRMAHEQTRFGAIWSDMFRDEFFLYSLRYDEEELGALARQYEDFKARMSVLSDSWDRVSGDTCPRLKTGVYLNQTNFDMHRIQENLKEGRKESVEQEPSFVVYNRLTQHSARLTADGYGILLLCDGIHTVEEIAGRVASLHGIEPAIAREKVISFLNSFATSSYLSAVPPS